MLRILHSIALLLLAIPATAQTSSWLHVEVDEPAEERSVRVRVPLAVVETVSEALEDQILEEIADALEHDDPDLDRFRAVWQSLRENPGAVVEIDEGGERALTARMDGSEVHIESDGIDGHEGTVNVRIPVELGDALLAGEPDANALAAALRELGDHHGDLVSVQSEDARVRIWVGPAQ